MATKKPTAESVTLDYPKRWIFGTGDQGKDDWIDGPIVDGRFVRFEQGLTSYGPKPLAILEVDGAERSIWLLHDAAFNRFRDELQRRSMPKLVVGERILIEKLGKTRSKNDRDYQAYRVLFPDAPVPDEEQLFQLDAPLPVPIEIEPTEPAAEQSGDDVPF